jgi:phage gp29-like protein
MAKTPVTPPKSKKLSKTGNTAGLAGDLVRGANKWREQYNYLRGLVMARAVALLEAGLMGDYPELQRVFALAEISNGTYVGLVERCLSPFSDFDWTIKQVPEEKLPPGTTKAMADKQAQTLRTAYDALDNLQEAIEHLALADFRGYSHLQIWRNSSRDKDDQAVTYGDPNDAYHLETLPQWKFTRDGMFGDWYWNPQMLSTMTPGATLGEINRIGSDDLPAQDFIIREVRAPINRVGLKFFIYTGLAEKDYAGFIEIFGIPSGVITMPPNVPSDQTDEYAASATQVAQGGNGTIPFGSTYTPNDSPRGTDPFTPYLRYWQEQLILAGTSGKLTMLAESGSGTLAGGAHEDTFGEVAGGRAKKISECFQRNFDGDVLRRKHAGEPVLAYFIFGAEEEEDVSALFDNVVKAANAGKNVDIDWLAEKSGYEFGPDLPSAVPINAGADTLKNRLFLNTDLPPDKLVEAIAADLRPVLAAYANRVESILSITDPALRAEKWQAAQTELASMEADILKDPSSGRILAKLNGDALAEGLAAPLKNRRQKNKS